MRFLLLLFFFIFSIKAFSIEGKNFIFFINGDWFYQGPVFEDEGVRLKDQANIIYRKMVERAKKDKKNNYAIFYDPMGKGGLLNRNWVKFRIYKSGKRMYGHGLKDSEIDTSSMEFINLFAGTIKKNLGLLKKEDSLFYYYGEHFPAYGESQLDLSSPNGGSFGLSKFLRMIEEVGEFHTVIFHTCYINALDFIGPILQHVDEVVVPEKAILNTPLDFNKSFKQDNFSDFNQRLIENYQRNEKYRFLRYGAKAKKLYQIMEELKEQVAKEYWQPLLKNLWRNGGEPARELSQDVFILSDWKDEKKKEVFLPHYEFINLIDRFLWEGEEKIDEIDRLIQKNNDLSKLFILLPPSL